MSRRAKNRSSVPFFCLFKPTKGGQLQKLSNVTAVAAAAAVAAAINTSVAVADATANAALDVIALLLLLLPSM